MLFRSVLLTVLIALPASRSTCTFNGQTYKGFEGDTLAAALLANGVDIIGRSFKYSRPRGISLPPTLPRMPITSVLTFGQPLVLVATRPWYSACCVARTLGIWVASVAPICNTAFGSSAPAAKMPRGREYLKLRPMISTS